MCGISGIVNLDFKPVDLNALQSMSDSLKHRGPDDQGFVGFSFKNNQISNLYLPSEQNRSEHFHGAIGFNRLSILDLSMNGHQPMLSENKKIAIAYNGETYNAFEFKKELETKGYVFKSKTDTEILLYIYQEYGINRMLDLMNGMFAFSVVDLEKQKVYLARDHAGIKPMYWYKKGQTLLFASEIKSFFKHPLFKAEIEEQHLDEYLYYKYCAQERTLFQKVKQIPAGNYLEIDTKGERLIQYWEPCLSRTNFENKNEAAKNLEEVLKSCIHSQLISDVKVGCQLSGGIDSSLVTTYARGSFDSEMDTFSVILQNKNYSEEKYINQVIKKTNPIAHKIDLNPDIFFENLISATWHLDVPLPIAQAVGIKELAKGASDHVTVLLSGEGSDELMGGYYQFFNQAFKAKNERIIKYMSRIPIKGEKIKKQYLPEISSKDYFIRYRATTNMDDFGAFRTNANLSKLFAERKEILPEHNDILKSTRVYDMRGWLVNILNIQDKMTMAHSIENRVPFLDKNLINYVFSLPSEFFVKSGYNPLNYNSPNHNTKIILKKLAAKYYNKDFVYRKKMGFNQPLEEYFSHKKMKEFMNDQILPGIKKRGLIDYNKLNIIWNNLGQPKNNGNMALLWNCFSFELWAQIFIDQKISV